MPGGEGDGDTGGLAEQDSFRSGAGQGVLLGRDLLRIALLQGMGSVRQLITSQATATAVSYSASVTAKQQKMLGGLAVIPLQEETSSCSGYIRGPPSRMWCLNLAVWCQGKVCVLESCSPLPVLGWGCRRLWVPFILVPWVGEAGGQAWQSLIDLNT